jgi:hypothetical protein
VGLWHNKRKRVDGGRWGAGEEGNKNFITIRETLEILIHLGLESPSVPSSVSMLFGAFIHPFTHLAHGLHFIFLWVLGLDAKLEH